MKSSSILTAVSSGSEMQTRNRYIVFRTQVALIISFFICWLPYHSQKLFFVINNSRDIWTENMLTYYEYAHRIAGLFYYLHSMLNPFLYSLCSQKFRTEIIGMTKQWLDRLRKCSNLVIGQESEEEIVTVAGSCNTVENARANKEMMVLFRNDSSKISYTDQERITFIAKYKLASSCTQHTDV